MRGKDPKRLAPDRMDHRSLLVTLIWTGVGGAIQAEQKAFE
ncbi:hypothetical protein SUDANB2_04594 [Streptomyces sp. enrichment culture]